MFKTLSRLFAATPAATRPARTVILGVSALEVRDCPAVLTAAVHDLHAPVAVGHPTAMMAMARPVSGLNPQPLPP